MHLFPLLLTLSLAAPTAQAAPPEKAETLDAMRRASRFMTEEVSCNGGYVWTYTTDLSRRWGEAPARPSQIWVQGGTPDMGGCFLDCWEATGDDYFLACAKKAANALVYGQHPLGGWHYFIEFDKPGLDQWYRDVFSNFKWGMEEYRHYYGNCTYDDDSTTGPASFLMRLYLATLDPAYREPLDRALAFIRESQYPNGGWPQRYPLSYEFVHDDLPDYTSLYTFNDGVITNNIDLLIEAYERLGDERCLEAARRGMDFIVLSQGPAGQAAWADQHGMDLNPAWARTHEHAGYMPRYTMANIRSLEQYYLFTGDRRYLEPIPGALDWLEKSAVRTLPDGRLGLANRYEYGTNRPVEIVRTDRVNNLGYGIWEWTNESPGTAAIVDIAALRREYEAVAALSPDEARARHAARRAPRQSTPRQVDPAEVRALMDALDTRGAWVEDVVVFSMDISKPSPPGTKWDNYNPNANDDHATAHIKGISTAAFVQHMRVLREYVAGMK